VARGAHIVVLTGPSSAGKSTLAAALRARVGPNMAAVSIDRLFAFMHPDSVPSWRRFAALTDATFRSAAALADAGFDVVADTVFERAECLEIMHSALGDRAHSLVAVTAPLEILEARERDRANRRIGQAREQYERGVFHAASYQLCLDTHAQATAESVERIIALLDAGKASDV
jgi:chloramphenicol 3-O phosphotransferase